MCASEGKGNITSWRGVAWQSFLWCVLSCIRLFIPFVNIVVTVFGGNDHLVIKTNDFVVPLSSLSPTLKPIRSSFFNFLGDRTTVSMHTQYLISH